MAEAIRYRVDLEGRLHHLVVVEMTVPADLAAGARLVFPAWTPGSYVIRDYVHHVQRISARDSRGRGVELHPDGVTAWWLPGDVEGPAIVELELYANDLTVRTNHVDEHHALLVGPASFPYVEEAPRRRHVVELEAPEGQQVFSLLPAGEQPDSYVAEDRDHLMDAAFEVGDHEVVDFEVAGVPHRFVWVARRGGIDAKTLAADAAALCEAAVELFGGQLPVSDYTFLCVGVGTGWGGLEHRDGATLMAPPTAFASQDQTRRLLSLLAHEYLHLWNVKRLIPADLQGLDYVEAAPTTCLWVVEGWTSYYDLLLPLRAGVGPWEHFAGRLATQVRSVRESPAAGLQSVREASWQAWVKHYVRDENSVNSSVNYYAHGALLAWCLDLLIRRYNPGANGLDTALQLLWQRFGNGPGYTEQDVQDACEEAAGRSLGDFFVDYVAAPATPPIEGLLDTVGLRLVDTDDRGRGKPWLGVDVEADEGRLELASVLRDGPAWEAGLTGGDELLTVAGLRASEDNLTELLAMAEPGSPVPVTVFRGSQLIETQVVPDPPRPRQRLEPVAQPSAAQQAAFHDWTGMRLGELGAGEPAERPNR